MERKESERTCNANLTRYRSIKKTSSQIISIDDQLFSIIVASTCCDCQCRRSITRQKNTTTTTESTNPNFAIHFSCFTTKLIDCFDLHKEMHCDHKYHKRFHQSKNCIFLKIKYSSGGHLPMIQMHFQDRHTNLAIILELLKRKVFKKNCEETNEQLKQYLFHIL